jgi:hypothetical protein
MFVKQVEKPDEKPVEEDPYFKKMIGVKMTVEMIDMMNKLHKSGFTDFDKNIKVVGQCLSIEETMQILLLNQPKKSEEVKEEEQ